jgi:uncharacterized protein
MIQSLKNLSALIDTAVAHAADKKVDVALLLSDRLVFDQFPFIRQVQIACDNAKGLAARLAEIENPHHPDTEATSDELKERVAKTIAFLESIPPESIIGKESVHVTLSYFAGKHFIGADYAMYYAMPNFYFHYVTAYSILRKNGVAIGKKEYLNVAPLLHN